MFFLCLPVEEEIEPSHVDPVTLAAGVGYASDQNDADPAADEDDEKIGVFVQAKYPITEAFFIVPEVTYWDGRDDAAGNEDVDSWHVGILWQANF